MGKSKLNNVFEETNYLKIKNLSFQNNKSVTGGGKTGSKVLIDNNNVRYQVKPSILDSATTRRIKARNLDQENFGELIAACVGRAVTDSNEEFELVPKVCLVYDTEKKRCEVASRYLKNSQTFDEYANKQGVGYESGHVKVSAYEKAKDGIFHIGGDSDQHNTFRKDLTACIAISMLNDDHDINAGNMMVLENSRIARIDFGHAFNDLLRAPKAFGGQLRNKNNNILDFLNRNTLSHLNPNNQETKLWKSYEGLIPSTEMSNALKITGNSKNIKLGLNEARSAFADLVHQLDKNPKENQKVISHIKRSLNSINKNIGGEKIDSKAPRFFEKFFNNMEKHYFENQMRMLEVAKLMELQVKIDKLLIGIKSGALNKELPLKTLQEIQTEFSQISKISSLKAGKDKIEWIKSGKDTPPFKGDLNGYLKYKSRELKINVNFNKDALIKSIQDTNDNITKINKPIGNNPQIHLKHAESFSNHSWKNGIAPSGDVNIKSLR